MCQLCYKYITIFDDLRSKLPPLNLHSHIQDHTSRYRVKSMYHLNVQRERGRVEKKGKKWIDMFSSPLSRLQRGQVRKALRI